MKKLLLFILTITPLIHWSQTPLYSNVPVSDIGTGNTTNASNTSKNVAVAPNGDIYVVFSGSQGVRVAKSTNRGQTFSASTPVVTGNPEAEIHVAQNAAIYVATSNGMVFGSTNQGASFSLLFSYTAGGPAHIASYQDKVYVVPQSGSSIYRSSDNGSDPWLVTTFGSSYAYSDVFVDSSDGTIYVLSDNPTIYLRKSIDGGLTYVLQTISPAVGVYYSSYAFSSGPLGKFVFIGGDNSAPGVRINLATNAANTISLASNTTFDGRTLVADEYGNFVDGYSNSGAIGYRVSYNQGANWQSPITLTPGTGLSIARNPVYQDIISVYTGNGQIYATVHGNILPGGVIATSATPALVYCQGATFSLPYTVTGTFNTGNIFTAQISNASGSFANPVSVGTVSSTTSGSVSVTIPAGIAMGSGYRFRVVSSNPSVVGTDNGSNVTINATPTATQPPNLQVCASTTLASFFLAQQTPIILNGQSTSSFAVSYHTTFNGANNNTNVITNINSYSAANGTTIYVRVRNVSSPTCFAITSFQLLVNPEPAVDSPADVTNCGPYTLPSLTNGDYFTEPNGLGTPLFAGDLIANSTTLYIFNFPTSPEGCSATSSFDITIQPGQTYYADTDSDGFGDADNTTFSCTGIPSGFVSNDLDCDDTQILYTDADGDGFGTSIIATCGSENSTDCDDSDETIFTSGTLFIDEDNDGYTTGATAVICHGFTAPSGYAFTNIGIDCNDAVAAINPGAIEVAFNGVDDDCDGTIDEGSQILTQVLPSQCGTTLTTINSLIGAIVQAAPVDGYRFRVVNMTTNAVQTIDRNFPNFSLTLLPSFDYATTYSISVMVRRNGIWLGNYGPSCLVSTPAILDNGGASAVTPSQCGITLPALSTLIATTSLQGVTGYRFRITNLTDNTAPNQVQILDRSIHWFALTMLNTYTYGTTYSIEVAVKTTGSYSGYGAPCAVTTPAVPGITNCGTATTPTMYFATTSMNRATSYRFELTDMTSYNTIIVDRPSQYFNFNQVPGYTPGGQYAIRVAVMTSGVWSLYGEACVITAPGTALRGITDAETEPQIAFRATGYPNPYLESFAIDMETPSTENVKVKVYDMIGKLVDEREFTADQIEAQQFGLQYPSGVYNVIVTQGEFTKTLRMIKR
ncbi:MAG: T9SS type A sorting domain-containing protein [Flavobacterium sp.]|uniref:T9SS type A sorting domain-containing protein n=1 Tax=Flavobacterium sp. TaxID=239 RepID=UPI0011FEC986|nr:T9SS type A sorting domain-containing protein [Flavobacterium sp.]RZJ66381.1 MAG: T9SS type A sorting domain-containing protein [Flavobacterium sp.]